MSVSPMIVLAYLLLALLLLRKLWATQAEPATDQGPSWAAVVPPSVWEPRPRGADRVVHAPVTRPPEPVVIDGLPELDPPCATGCEQPSPCDAEIPSAVPATLGGPQGTGRDGAGPALAPANPDLERAHILAQAILASARLEADRILERATRDAAEVEDGTPTGEEIEVREAFSRGLSEGLCVGQHRSLEQLEALLDRIVRLAGPGARDPGAGQRA